MAMETMMKQKESAAQLQKDTIMDAERIDLALIGCENSPIAIIGLFPCSSALFINDESSGFDNVTSELMYFFKKIIPGETLLPFS